MSDTEGEGHMDNWVFDSLVNFLHGSIWKVPVVGFIEEKSVVFDPDSYNNMTEEKEQEFRKIHEEYKGVVDFMLTSFMEDLQVTPEQVEEACRVREHQSKTLPESHITKVALEQLWAAEDFTAFRRLMTRKNIDLQLQSLELLVAKYGILSPALRSGDSEDTADDGEDDFLQVVIRYSDQLESFKCDYGSDATSPGFTNSRNSEDVKFVGGVGGEKHIRAVDDSDGKNMKLHLAGVTFKNNFAPTPVHYQATLTSNAATSSSSANNRPFSSPSAQSHTQPRLHKQISLKGQYVTIEENEKKLLEEMGHNETEEGAASCIVVEPESPPDDLADLSTTTLPDAHVSPTPPPSPSPPNENIDSSMIDDETQPSKATTSADLENSEENSVPPTILETDARVEEQATDNGDTENNILPTNEPLEMNSEEKESQLIQLEEADAAIEEESNIKLQEEEAKLAAEAATDEARGDEDSAENQETESGISAPIPAAIISPNFDEKTAVEIAATAPEQRRLLTAVRKALEINPDESSDPLSSIDIPNINENDEDLQKRREYLRAQRDKLIAMKKQEREKLLLANTAATSGQSSARPKSARAAQMALKNPTNMRAVSLSEKSLSARRALADRLKQELIEK